MLLHLGNATTVYYAWVYLIHFLNVNSLSISDSLSPFPGNGVAGRGGSRAARDGNWRSPTTPEGEPTARGNYRQPPPPSPGEVKITHCVV